jgi:hypothetical protein
MLNKKSYFTVVLISLILIINLIQALDSPTIPLISETENINPDTGLPEGIEKIQKISENLTDKEIRSQYLKQEWGKILEKNKYAAPIIQNYKKVSPYTDPVFKYTLGIVPSLTWLFFLTLTIWIAFAIYLFRMLELVAPFSEWVQKIISLGITIILGISGLIEKLAEYIIKTIGLFSTWWMQLIGIVIIIIFIIIGSILSGSFRDLIKDMYKRKKELEEEINRKKLKGNVEIVEKFTKAITED